MKNEQKTRFYSWKMISYMSEDNLRRALAENCRNWAYILHDKDIFTAEDEKSNPKNKEGTLKTPHFHVVCTFDREKSANQVTLLFDSYSEGQNTMKMPCMDIGDSLLYLTHETQSAIQDGKHMYPRGDMKISHEAFYAKYIKGDEVTDTDTFVDDLLSESFSAERMGRLYGRDFIKNFRSYIYFREVVHKERAVQKSTKFHYDYFSDSYVNEFGEVVTLRELKGDNDEILR